MPLLESFKKPFFWSQNYQDSKKTQVCGTNQTLFLGFLLGIPFFWTLVNNVLPWALATSILAAIFYLFDKGNKSDYSFGDDVRIPTSVISIKGSKNFLWLLVIVSSIFLDPNVLPWVPAIHYHGQNFSFIIRELIWLSCAFLSHKMADVEALRENDFNFEPIREVAFIFVGIFGTMMPALEIVGNSAASAEGSQMITHNSLYWGTGLLSGVLDNAPTYINFLTAAMAAKGADVNVVSEVVSFSNGGYENSIIYLKAISVAAVFFGAMTYIGNGPN